MLNNIIITLIALPFIIYAIFDVKKSIIDNIREMRSMNRWFKQYRRENVVGVEIKRIEGE